jgi:hypothetical protein
MGTTDLVFSLLIGSGSLRSLLQPSLLLLLSLRTVLVQKFVQLRSRVFIESVRELSNGRGDF